MGESEPETYIHSGDSDMDYSYEEEAESGRDGDDRGLMAGGDEEEENEDEEAEWSELDDIGTEAFASLRLAPGRGGAARAASQEDIEHYLRGLLWTLQMYTTGSCPDASYSYFGNVIFILTTDRNCPFDSLLLPYILHNIIRTSWCDGVSALEISQRVYSSKLISYSVIYSVVQ
jgi:hypothetical protein